MFLERNNVHSALQTVTIMCYKTNAMRNILLLIGIPFRTQSPVRQRLRILYMYPIHNTRPDATKLFCRASRRAVCV